MLESLSQTNIGNLNLTEPLKEIEPPFDPSTEITNSDWDWIENDLKKIAPKPDLTEFLWIGSVMRVLNPERASKFKEFDEVWPRVRDYMVYGNPGYMNKDSYQFTIGHIKMLYPDEFAQSTWCNEVMTQPAISYIRNHGGANRLLTVGQGGGLRDRKVVGLLKVAFPDSIYLNPRGVLELLEGFQDFDTGGRVLLAEAGYVRLLGPKEYKMSFKNDVWKTVRNYLNQYLDVDTTMFSEVALAASILAATEVDISNGLKLTIPKGKDPDLHVNIPALPEVRKF
ncbi:MAG: hypothetical protein Q7R49_01890 [Candidatus Daviesbacteria bacterium]|nr:hypothetical protein [Candidatus Daviesbacteria bacterium]